MTLCLTCRNEGGCIETSLRKIRGECEYYKPITNADRIRQMTDEELADYLRWHNDSYSRYGMDWLDWLKAPMEVDNVCSE